MIGDPTSFWKCLPGSKAQKHLQKLSHSDWSKRIMSWPTMSACLGNDTPFIFYKTRLHALVKISHRVELT